MKLLENVRGDVFFIKLHHFDYQSFQPFLRTFHILFKAIFPKNSRTATIHIFSEKLALWILLVTAFFLKKLILFIFLCCLIFFLLVTGFFKICFLTPLTRFCLFNLKSLEKKELLNLIMYNNWRRDILLYLITRNRKIVIPA